MMQYKGIPKIERLNEWAELAVSFEYNDFMLPHILEQKEEVENRVNKYLQLLRDRSSDTIHGPFLDIAVHSSDEMIRKVSDYRIRQVCDIGMKLQVKAIILHTNLIGNFYEEKYRQTWLERNERYLKTLLCDYPKLSVYMENMFDDEPDMLVALAERMQGERFGICLDIAHANLSKTEVSVWHEACKPYLAQYHINDNDGKVDGHLPIGEGNIAWENVLPILRKDIPHLIEVDSFEKFWKSMAYINKQNT